MLKFTFRIGMKSSRIPGLLITIRTLILSIFMLWGILKKKRINRKMRKFCF